MDVTISYNTSKEKANLIGRHEEQGFRLKEDAIRLEPVEIENGEPILERKFYLTFTDEPESEAPPDLKAEWQAATTTTEQLKILARRLGLEE